MTDAGKKKWPLVRFIAPAYPNVNIYSRIAKKMTPLGLIMVATCASKLWGLRVEIIDENNYTGPKTKNGLPDHIKLQEQNPADIVGFYCGLTSTMDRVYELALYYKTIGVKTIAGGKHTAILLKEALDNNIDIVIFGEGEIIIRSILLTLNDNAKLDNIPGIAFLKDGEIKLTLPRTRNIFGYDPALDNLPYPDYGLVKYAKIKCYPIGRIRGCGMFCEFCSVNESPAWASPEHLFETVSWLHQTRKAKSFFIVDDRLEEDLEGYAKFFQMIRKRFGNKLLFTVQIRLGLAEKPEFLKLMKRAGVWAVCVGCESPIDQELKAMRKGYTSRHMISWTRTLRKMFWLHEMFIYRYPGPNKEELLISEKEREKKLKWFIRKSGGHSVQILQLVPLPGTKVRQRLEKEGRLLPRDVAPWKCYDGGYVCYVPEGITVGELQKMQIRIMKWFYSPLAFWRIPLRTLLFPIDYLVRGWQIWKNGWLMDIIKYGGHLMLKRRDESHRLAQFSENAEKYIAQKNPAEPR